MSSADRRRQKRVAEKKKQQKQNKHLEKFGGPPPAPVDPPCTLRHIYGQGFLHRNGPLLQAEWDMPAPAKAAIVASGGAPPAPVRGSLLLDTGATNTCISLKAAQQLGLHATRMQDGYGAGGLHKLPVFFALLTISVAHPTRGLVTIKWEQEVQGIPDLDKQARGVKAQGQETEVVGLLGRDILRHTRLSYDGIDGELTITFDLQSLQQQPSR